MIRAEKKKIPVNTPFDIEVRIGVNPELPAISGFTPILTSISKGGSPEKKIFFALITAIAFSYIRTEFGASRSMRVGVRSAKL